MIQWRNQKGILKMWDNVSENAVNHKVMDAAIAVLREILIALNAYINLFFHLNYTNKNPTYNFEYKKLW